jgi:hypothetical protein
VLQILESDFGQLITFSQTRAYYQAPFKTVSCHGHHWRASLKWRRREPYETFAQLIDRHWDGIVAFCKPGNKVSPGFVEGLNNKIRVIATHAGASAPALGWSCSDECQRTQLDNLHDGAVYREK